MYAKKHRRLCLMKPISRRSVLSALGAGMLSPGLSAATGQTANTPWPAISVMVPASPGGGWDTTGRALGQALVDSRMVNTVRYEVRSGGAGTIGLAQFAREHAGDPHALMVMGSVMLGGILTGKPPVTLDAVTPIARLSSEYNVIAVPASSRYKTMADLLAQFRSEPSSIRWGGGSRGATEHIVLSLLAQALGQRPEWLNYVPFRGGGEAAAALVSGSVAAASSGISEFMPYIQRGLMRPLAVTSPKRMAGLDVPTLKELGHDVVFGNWRGVYGAPRLNPAAQQQLTALVEKAVQHSSWQNALHKHQWSHSWLSGQAFADFVQQDMQTMNRIMQAAGLS